MFLSVLFVPLLFGVGSLANINRILLPDQRIVGGEPVEISSHPYQLTFQRFDAHSCGAAIISRKWAITAGHCVGYTPTAANSKLGAGNKHRYNGTFYNVSRVVRHPEYDYVAIDYDIALLEIEGEFSFGENVKPIKLTDRELENGEIVNVTGWGVQVPRDRSDLLMRVTVPIINRPTCREAYKKFKIITDRMICAGLLGEGGKDSCQGDSGGPLSANGVLYGLVSWGFGCARPNYPGVYTNIANLRPWIRNITGI